MATSSVIVGYWSTRGRGGVVRNLISYCGIPYENKVYKDFPEWFGKDKQTLGFDYPNLPYLIDGDKKITETSAILYYIALKAGKRELIGDTDDKFIQVQVVCNVIHDMFAELMKPIVTKGDFNAEKEEAFSKGALKEKLEVLNKNLEGKDWLCGFLSIADFQLFEGIDLIHEMDATKLENYPNLTSLYKRFLEIPQVKAHRSSPEFLKAWFPPNWTAWNNI